MKKNYLLILLVAFTFLQVSAQRYLTPIFNTVNVNTVIYGENYTVLAVPTLGKTLKQPLVARVYTPNGDTETKRPVVIYMHTGNFLPQSVTQSPNGNLDDSCAIEICTRLAKMGYVAVSADYRLGWNPVAQTQEERTNTLINAAYRGVQDGRTCVRYFKKNYTTFGVDTTKFVIWGQGTGGYPALAIASLSSYTEVLTTTNPAGKFFKADGTPMVIWKLPASHPQLPNFVINGDIEGKDLGLVPPGTVGPPKGGDTLCLPNHINQNSDVQLCVNMGGALGDLSWLDKNTPPMISFQVPWDPFAPYQSAVLRVPISPMVSLPVVEVQGAYTTQERMDSLGNNNVFDKILPSFDPFKSLVTARAGKYIRGLFPLYGDNATDSSPWDFWSTDSIQNPYWKNGLVSNPNMSPAKAKRYIDTIMTYYIPRACVALNLPCAGTVTSNQDLVSNLDVPVTIAPNPAESVIRIETADQTIIKEIYLYDINGRMISVNQVNNTQFILNRPSGLPQGLYTVGLKFEKGLMYKKVMFN
ncbi:MAG: T9SS type A sorting domain-containing protein [Saprospiraceae bacterium]|nr:T9SS type A sorting domain-containing protein [Saprospiraceae bacterium]